MMASSTTMPIARIRPNRLMVLMREAEREQGREGADQRHRDGDRRDQGRAPVLQEDVDDKDDESEGLQQGDDHLADRGLHIEGRVVCHLVGEIGRGSAPKAVHLAP